jgi:hypothetical protein
VSGQWVIGYFLNDWLLANGSIIIVIVLGTLGLFAVTASAHYLQQAAEAHV